jgi:hypothetical protein
MRKSTIVSVLLLGGIAPTGCTGICDVRAIGTASLAESDYTSRERLAAAISDAVIPLGFSRDQASDGFGFSKPEAGYADNMFSRSKRVDIYVSFGDPKTLWISIKDYGTRRESTDVKEAEDAIRRSVASHFGTAVTFKPVADCLS